jgi:Lhr-like helicase
MDTTYYTIHPVTSRHPTRYTTLAEARDAAATRAQRTGRDQHVWMTAPTASGRPDSAFIESIHRSTPAAQRMHDGIAALLAQGMTLEEAASHWVSNR